MTKRWIMYILAAFGLVVVAMWAYRKLTSKQISSDNTVVRVDIDDPGMEPVHFDSSQPAWDPSFFDKVPLNRQLTTTFVKK